MNVITSLASEASFVSLVRKWNAMVPRMETAMILRELATNVTSKTAFDGFADAVGSESIDGVRGLRGFDGARR